MRSNSHSQSNKLDLFSSAVNLLDAFSSFALYLFADHLEQSSNKHADDFTGSQSASPIAEFQGSQPPAQSKELCCVRHTVQCGRDHNVTSLSVLF